MKKDNLSEIIRENAQKYNGRRALTFKEDNTGEWRAISWKIFFQKIQMVAKAIANYGLSEKENIAIFSRNMPEWTIADYGILRARCTVVPMYPTNSPDQVEYIVSETGFRLIFVGEQEQYDVAKQTLEKKNTLEKIVVFDESVNISGEDSVYFSDFLKMGAEVDDSEINRRIENSEPNDNTTIIYTSGTTGEPKGVILQNKNFANTFRIHEIRLDINDGDVSLAFLPLCHIFERGWTYFVFKNGLTNVYLKDPKEIVDAIKEVKPTIMCAVPRFFEKVYAAVFSKLASASSGKRTLFMWAIGIGRKHIEKVRLEQNDGLFLGIKYFFADKMVLKKLRGVFGGNIKFIPCAGAPLSQEILEFFHSAGIFIIYGYGLTETCATVTAFKSTGFEFGTVGSPMPDVALKIGKNNEILIKGDSNTIGYYKKLEITEASFEDGWLKTGDAGSINEDGDLIITDRIKDVIITSGGKNISPQRIECAIIQESEIEQLAVIGDQRKFVSALIVPAYESLEKFAEEHKITYSSREDLLDKPKIQAHFLKILERAQEHLAEYEKIKRFKLLPAPFTIENHELTPTLKVRRKTIMTKYCDIIDSMY